jgi:hypothetical protein
MAVMPDGSRVSWLFTGQFFAVDAQRPHGVFTDLSSINNLGQMAGRVVLATDDPARPTVSQGLVLTPLSAEATGTTQTLAFTASARASTRQTAQAQRLAETGVRVVLDPCAEEDGQTIVPLRLRGLCVR